MGYGKPDYSDPIEKKVNRNYRCVSIIVAAFILCLCATVTSVVIASISIGKSDNDQSSKTYLTSGLLDQTPFSHYLDSTGTHLAMNLENDLSVRVGRIYRIWSRSAQPHTVTILNGAQTSTWDGVNKKATFGGSIGDGFVFEIIDKNKIAVISVTNVVFS